MLGHTSLTSQSEPGGYIQWDEIDWETRRTVKADPSISDKDMQALHNYVSKWEDALGSREYES